MTFQFALKCGRKYLSPKWLNRLTLSKQFNRAIPCVMVQELHGFHPCLRYKMTSSSSSVQFKSEAIDCESEAICTNHTEESSNQPVLKLNKVAVISKTTRYDFERQRYEEYSEDQFKEALSIRGSNYKTLLDQHKKHLETMSTILDVLKKRGIEYRICTRGNAAYCKEAVEWADAIITAGGDGTFLSAASKIKTRTKPLIGINTDPRRSEGHLCLPAKYSSNFDEALSKIAKGKFKWLYRQRIRITMTGSKVNFKPIDNGDMLQERMRGGKKPVSTYLSINDAEDDSYLDNPEQEQSKSGRNFGHRHFRKVLPTLALNEVFIGESLSSVPSYYELQVDKGMSEKQKSSGLCVCTGTGSTAWSHNICRLHPESVKTILKISGNLMFNSDEKQYFEQLSNEKLIQEVTEIYGNSFLFEANESKMLYSIRDPMQNKVYRCENPHGYAKEILIRSRCWDAALCIDGDTSFVFNDGATASLQVLPENALKTIILKET